MVEGSPWWLVAIFVVVCLYYGWRAYLHHRWPTDRPFDRDEL